MKMLFHQLPLYSIIILCSTSFEVMGWIPDNWGQIGPPSIDPTPVPSTTPVPSVTRSPTTSPSLTPVPTWQATNIPTPHFATEDRNISAARVRKAIMYPLLIFCAMISIVIWIAIRDKYRAKQHVSSNVLN